MRFFQKPQEALENPRSENHRDLQTSRWYAVTTKLLHMTRGPFSQDITMLVRPATCRHPAQHVVTGANQYGRWTKCLACKKQIGYQAYGPDNPKPSSSKKPANTTAVALTAEENVKTIKKTAAVVAHTLEQTGEFVTRQEMQQMMQEQNKEIQVGIAQALGPLIQQQQLIQQQMMAMMQSQPSMAPQQMAFPRGPQHFTLDQEDFSDEVMPNPNDWDHVHLSR